MIELKFTGYVGTVQEPRKHGEKDEVINFSVAVTEFSTDPDKKPTWVECSIWNKPKLFPHIKKGVHVLVSGSAKAKAFIKTGETTPTASLACDVDFIELLSSNKEEKASE